MFPGISRSETEPAIATEHRLRYAEQAELVRDSSGNFRCRDTVKNLAQNVAWLMKQLAVAENHEIEQIFAGTRGGNS
jgi:hypothetical protein